MASYEDTLRIHYQRRWGAPVRQLFAYRGPVHQLPMGFSVLEFKAGSHLKYATVGMGPVCGLEFFVIAREQDDHHVQTLSVVSHYAKTGPGLGLGHTAFLGEGWLPGSACDYLLLSTPYTEEPVFASFEHHDDLFLCVWLLPIT